MIEQEFYVHIDPRTVEWPFRTEEDDPDNLGDDADDCPRLT